ncbi:hypothetical protein [Micromonospora sp. NPDC005652]|uniref:hypothetical protein n=1 Tax=Micromonospora sp. NPDC005652 TaxID=3157046 RepID=UPI0033D2D682
MHQHNLGLAAVLNIVANLVIVAGYVLVPFTVLRRLPLTRNVLAAGTLFFTTCAATHLAMAANATGSPLMVANHVLQAASVIWFVIAFSLLLRAAHRRRPAQERGGPPGEPR